MLPWVLAAASVTLGATALAFLLDRETPEEWKLQDELQRDKERLYEELQTLRRESGHELATRRERLAKQLAARRARACRKYRARIDLPMQEFADLAASLQRDLSDKTISPFRRNALVLLRGRLEDTRNRLAAFDLYAEWYLGQQDRLADGRQYEVLITFADPAPRLPEDWYYDGKVGLASVLELGKHRNAYGQQLDLKQDLTQGLQEPKYSDAFQRALLLQHPDQEAIPVQLLASKNARYFKACILRGAVYVEHILEKRPCVAIVSRLRNHERLGEGYEVRCFPGFCRIDNSRGMDSGIRAFLPRSESAFPGKRYQPGERLEVLPHHHDLTLKNRDLTVTQQPASLALLGGSAAPVFLLADGALHELDPMLNEAASGATWQLRDCRETPHALLITLQLGAWQIEAQAEVGEAQLRVTSLARGGMAITLDQLPFSLRLIDQKFSQSVYCDVLRFQEFTNFCRQQALFGQDADARRTAGQFFERWRRVTDFLLEESGYQTFWLEARGKPQDHEWDCACGQDLRASIERMHDGGRSPPRLFLEELHVNHMGERWLQVAELKGVPDALSHGVLRLSHAGVRRPRPEQGFRPAVPPALRVRVPNGGELANLDRQKRALQAFMSGRMLNPALQQILLMPDRYAAHPDPVWAERVKTGLSWQNPLWQDPSSAKPAKQVVEAALIESNLYLIQGPPGTGKTTCIVELLHQIYAAGPETRVLVVSQQNTAVDNALSGFVKRYPEHAQHILRIGSDAEKVHEDLRPRATDEVLGSYLVGRQQAYSRAAALGQTGLANSIDGWIKSIYTPGTNERPAKFDEELTGLIVRDHKLVGATCVGLASRRHGTDRLEFDVCIVDEGGRSTVPELLIPLMRSRKVIIIGDHFQLPPSIASRLREADAKETLPFLQETFLKSSFFEHLYNNLQLGCRGRLVEQYRMVEPIGDLVADLFYSQKGDRGLINGKLHDRKFFLDPEHPLRWHDVPLGRQEKERGVGTSLVNLAEAQEIVHFLTIAAKALASRRASPGAALAKKTVAIITPYGAQKRHIAELLRQGAAMGHEVAEVMHIEVDTVDSFQGSEADIVLYSTVRTHGAISFLLDRQRLNVACSRARENLVFFGSMDFLRAREARSGEFLFSRIIERAALTPTRASENASRIDEERIEAAGERRVSQRAMRSSR
jgi:hypothetical protein